MKKPQNTPRFLVLLRTILTVEDKTIISWCDDGNAFEIIDMKSFTNVLPKYFKHQNFASFCRQLNYFNFHKIHHREWVFIHLLFQRDHVSKQVFIQRCTKGKRVTLDQKNELFDVISNNSLFSSIHKDGTRHMSSNQCFQVIDAIRHLDCFDINTKMKTMRILNNIADDCQMRVHIPIRPAPPVKKVILPFKMTPFVEEELYLPPVEEAVMQPPILYPFEDQIEEKMEGQCMCACHNEMSFFCCEMCL